MKGKIKFLDIVVGAEVVVNPPKRFLVDINLGPIDWIGGLIQLRRNATDRKNGPKAFIYLTTSSITVQIEGYISLLGISAYVNIDVSDTAFKFNIEGSLWGIIRAQLYVEAAYGSLATLGFKVSTSIHFNMCQGKRCGSIIIFIISITRQAEYKLPVVSEICICMIRL